MRLDSAAMLSVSMEASVTIPADKTFRCSVRVPYAHIDQMGFVYYSNYLIYFENARTEMLRQAGMPYTELEKRGVMLPVIEAACFYKQPARYDDLLEIRTRCTELRGTRLRIEYEVVRDGHTLATGHTVHAFMSPQGKVLRPVPEIGQLVAEK